MTVCRSFLSLDAQDGYENGQAMHSSSFSRVLCFNSSHAGLLQSSLLCNFLQVIVTHLSFV